MLEIIKWGYNSEVHITHIFTHKYCLNCDSCVRVDLGHVHNAVPEIWIIKVIIDIGVELAVCILSTGPLACVWIIHQLIANVRGTEIHAFVSQFDPVC